MQERTLLRISLITTAIGIILLYILSQYSQPEQVQPYTLTNSDLGNKVLVQGNIGSIKQYGNTTIIKVSTNDQIQVVHFQPLKFSLNKNEQIEIIGTVQKHKGEYQLISDEIRII
jgi:hypothetical protein